MVISMSITELMDRIISKRDTSAFIKLVEKAVEKTNILFMRKLSLQAVWYEVEDYSEHTLDFIFDKIQRELKSKSKEIKEFKLVHPEFCDYFGGDNKERFISTLSEIPKYGRDYYLYFCIQLAG